MIAAGKRYITWDELTERVSEVEILALYFDFPRLPFVMPSPFRTDRSPSFECFEREGRISFFDFSTRDSYSLLTFLSSYWKLSIQDTLERIENDIANLNDTNKIKVERVKEKWKKSNYKLSIKTRPWRDYDIQYWKRFGISLEWLTFANVYPISFKIRSYEDGKTLVFSCDKYAYAFYERKDNIDAFKIYQPYNQNGWKWDSSFRDGVMSLWTKIPQTGNGVCICSSLKDALCLWANTGIPAIAPQGEGYSLSDTVIKDLKARFKYVFVLFDIDEAGRRFSSNLCEKTGFIRVMLPAEYGCKDISDLYAFFASEQDLFRQIVIKCFSNGVTKQENQKCSNN